MINLISSLLKFHIFQQFEMFLFPMSSVPRCVFRCVVSSSFTLSVVWVEFGHIFHSVCFWSCLSLTADVGVSIEVGGSTELRD